MHCDALQDLLISGVQWEINEVPNTPTYTNITKPTQNSQSGPTHSSTAIVPPIAPAHTISMATVVAMAARPSDIDSMCRMISEFNHPLRRGATNVVLPHIAPNPNGVMILTDMPGADDDESGKILSGPSGDMIDKMLNAIDMSRDMVSIVPMLFWRTPGGRTPSVDEIALSRPFVKRIIEMLNPALIVTLGSLPAMEFGNVQLAKGHGIAVDTTFGAKLLPIYHPNYLALKPSAKRDVWNALQNIQNLLKTVQK